MLARLEAKGLVRRRQEGVRNVYSVTVSPATASRTALQQYLQTFFGGSLRLMLASLVREGSWSDEDLDALRAEIDKARRERTKP
jgi:predicted transcriptional regulator